MQITKLHPPINCGTLFCGRAVSRRGRQYDFCATPEGEACCVWWQLATAPRALRTAVEKAVHDATKSAAEVQSPASS